MKWLEGKPLTFRFCLLTAILIAITAFSAKSFYNRQERNHLEIRLREKAAFLNNFYSFLIGDALMRKDDITLLQVVNRLEEDKEITSVVVVDDGGFIRYHIDPQTMGERLEDELVKTTLKSGEATMNHFVNAGGRALSLVSPLKVQGAAAPIGAVRIDFTYRAIGQTIAASAMNYWFIILGSLSLCTTLMLVFLNKWVVGPLQAARTAIGNVNPAAPEPALPEPPNELGELNAAVNQLLLRLRNQMQQTSADHTRQAEQEQRLVRQLMSVMAPDARVLLANKDNEIISDSGNGAGSTPGGQHLLDLIKDSNFGTLLNSAFQNEGEVARGPVTVDDKPYFATVLSIPSQQSIAVKTLIALTTPKEAV